MSKEQVIYIEKKAGECLFIPFSRDEGENIKLTHINNVGTAFIVDSDIKELIREDFADVPMAEIELVENKGVIARCVVDGVEVLSKSVPAAQNRYDHPDYIAYQEIIKNRQNDNRINEKAKTLYAKNNSVFPNLDDQPDFCRAFKDKNGNIRLCFIWGLIPCYPTTKSRPRYLQDLVGPIPTGTTNPPPQSSKALICLVLILLAAAAGLIWFALNKKGVPAINNIPAETSSNVITDKNGKPVLNEKGEPIVIPAQIIFESKDDDGETIGEFVSLEKSRDEDSSQNQSATKIDDAGLHQNSQASENSEANDSSQTTSTSQNSQDLNKSTNSQTSTTNENSQNTKTEENLANSQKTENSQSSRVTDNIKNSSNSQDSKKSGSTQKSENEESLNNSQKTEDSQNSETTDSTENSSNSQDFEKSGNSKESEETENSNNSQGTEASQNSETADNSENSSNSQDSEKSETNQKSEASKISNNSQKTEKTQESEESQKSETANGSKNSNDTQGSKESENSQKTESSENRQTSESSQNSEDSKKSDNSSSENSSTQNEDNKESSEESSEKSAESKQKTDESEKLRRNLADESSSAGIAVKGKEAIAENGERFYAITMTIEGEFSPNSILAKLNDSIVIPGEVLENSPEKARVLVPFSLLNLDENKIILYYRGIKHGSEVKDSYEISLKLQ